MHRIVVGTNLQHLRVPLVISAAVFSSTIFAQSIPSDNTNTPLMQELKRKFLSAPSNAREKDDPRGRLEWERTARGKMTAPARRKHFDEFQREKNKYADDHDQPAWVNIGPTRSDYSQYFGYQGANIDSGRARKILPHPTDPNTVYLLSSGGGLWRTTNFGTNPPNWKPLTDNLPTTSGGSVTFGRKPNTLYLGLGDPLNPTLPGGVMVKSTNGGDDWSSPIPLGDSLSIRDVEVDTSGPKDIVLVASDTGIWRSVDGGGSYSQVAGGVGQAMAGQAAWSIVRSSKGWLASAEACVFFCGQGSLYLSVDHGATWSPITDAGGVLSDIGRTTLAVGASGDNIVYAFAASHDDNDQGDLFRSVDGGQTWQALHINGITPSNPNFYQADMDLMSYQAWYNQLILVDPTDPARTTVYLGGVYSSAKTTDGGQSWTLLTDGFPLDLATPIPYAHVDFHAAAFSQFGNHRTLFFGNDGGLSVSTDNGNSWSSSKNENLVTHLFYTIGGNPNFPNVSFGGTQDNGTLVQEEGTTTFNQSFGGDGDGTGWSQATTDTSVASLQYGVVGKNNTNRPPDNEWNFDDYQFPDVGIFTPVTFPSAVADPKGKVVFVTGNFNVYRSSDGGQTWSSIATIPTGIRDVPFVTGVSPLNLSHLAVGGVDGHVMISMDGGVSFADYALNTLVPGFASNIWGVDWSDDKTIYVASTTFLTGYAHVAKGTFDGAQWTFSRADNGLPDVSVLRVVRDPSNPKTLYAATGFGVYRSQDAGAHWQRFGRGLPSVIVTDIYIPPSGRYLRIATYGRGIWELPGVNFKQATVVDDGAGSDRNGVLDRGESGHLQITVHNEGASRLGDLTATVTSSNPDVQFPSGKSIHFSDASPDGDATASLEIALKGSVSGIQQVEFAIALDPHELGTTGPVVFPAWATMNYKESAGQTDSVEAAHTSWTVTGVAAVLPDVFNWTRRENGPFQHSWAIGDSSGITDQALVSPILKVGIDPLVISFRERHSFEWDFVSSFYDGGVIEISIDDGANWSDIGSGAYGGTLAAGGGNPLEGRKAFVAQNVNYPGTTPVTLNLGTAYANKKVRIRFRVGTDFYLGHPGWEIDHISVAGITNNPFVTLVGSH